ncbi:MAG: diadenylate cyclase CdaA [Lentisphaeria bacterium]|nr:diadenylate cyclase CdaA [Lentisphaeria bacterium]
MFMQLWEILSDWRALVQIAVLFLFIYQVLYHLRNSRGSLVLAGLLIFLFILWGLSKIWSLNVLSKCLEIVLNSLPLMLMIIFQPELRRLFAQIGSMTFFKNNRRKELIAEIVNAVQNMAKQKCGALIVIECKVRLQPLIDDAIELDAKVNSLILESIFYPKSPLHDGAVIIRNDRIVAARAILPLSSSEQLSRQMGTRHRAALGIAEESDSVTILVSEESGSISIAHDEKLYRDISASELHRMLDTLVIQRNIGEFDETVLQISANDEAQLSAETSESEPEK